MTQAQFLSVVRAALNVIGTILMTYGAVRGLDEQTWVAASGAVLTLAGIGWGLFAHTPASTVKAAADVKGVEVVVGPTAPPALRALAVDPSVSGIVAKK